MNLTSTQREFTLAVRLLEDLMVGKVYAISGCIYNTNHDYVMSTIDMYDTVCRLGKLGFIIERTDAGGSPTWELTSVPPEFTQQPKTTG